VAAIWNTVRAMQRADRVTALRLKVRSWQLPEVALRLASVR
jgi:hypothetical protein